jgi:hypothetical protein
LENTLPRALALSLGLAASLVSASRLSRAQSPTTAIVSLLDTLTSDSATGFRRIARDSALINVTDLTWFGGREPLDSLDPAGLQIRHAAYLECAATAGPMSRAARATCALRDFPYYIELAPFFTHGDSAQAEITLSHLAEEPRRPSAWYRRLGSSLATALGRHETPHPPLWFRIYAATFTRGSDGRWTTVRLRPAQFTSLQGTILLPPDGRPPFCQYAPAG